MATNGSAEALRNYRAAVSLQKQRDVLRAVQDLAAKTRSSISVSSVSRAAGVSREFIHSHEHLREAVRQAANLARETEDSPARLKAAETTQGLRADRATLRSQVERLRSTVADQRRSIEAQEHQRQLWLGAQLEAIQPHESEALTELRLAGERLTQENVGLRRQVEDLKSIVAVLEDELAASREAHSEDLRRLAQDAEKVVKFRRATVRH